MSKITDFFKNLFSGQKETTTVKDPEVVSELEAENKK